MDSKSAHRSVQPKKLSFQLLEEITDNFSEELILGRGGFGVVYKGKYRSGKEIAVKMLNPMKELDDKRFWNEFQNLTRLKHPNIVELVGFCNETEKKTKLFNGRPVTAEEIHRALCFEYMHNGNLRKHLTDPHQGLDWHTRFNIIKGVCDGLRHLHKELEAPIYHLDLKPDNILLDKNMVPKIADFGLSRLFGNENTQKTLSSLGGTRGYMPPEYIRDKIVSGAFDIFSLGVIIIKIMMGPTGYYQVDDMEASEFIEFVQDDWNERLQRKPGYSSLEDDCKQVKRCIEIARNCVDKEPTKRPSIGYIVSELNKFHVEGSTLSRSDTHGRPSSQEESGLLTQFNMWPQVLHYEFLRHITDDFSADRLIDHGESAEVFKGITELGECIAVKRFIFSSRVQDDKDFEKRTGILLFLKHENIVRLIGYCCENQNQVVEHRGRFVIADVCRRIHCLEYLSNGSLRGHIHDKSNKLDWDMRLRIIIGICKGLRFLHEQPEPIVHMGITADNVLLDKNMEPKITGFSQSRFCSEEKTKTRTTGETGEFSRGCMAPEFLFRGEVTIKSDIYSLGILILEIVTGETLKGNRDPSGQHFVEEVSKTWTLEHIFAEFLSLADEGIEQVEECIKIGLKCARVDRYERPSIGEIVARLDQIRSEEGEMSNKISPGFLTTHPLQLFFNFKQNRLACSSLHLTNNKDDHVAFRLQSNSPGRYLTKLPICGTVPPGCTYTLNVTMRKHKQQPESSGNDILTLQSSIVGKEDLKNVDPDSIIVEYESFFERSRGTIRVHEVTLQVVSDPLQDKTSEKPIHSGAEVVATQNCRPVMSTDVHPTLQWIMTSHPEGDVCIWDYLTLGMVKSFKLTDEPVGSAKFVVRKEWIVAGDDEGFIYVSGYDTTESCTSFQAHDRRVTYLAVHPTLPYILSSSEDRMIKLWDWNWQCTRTFQGHSDTVTQVMFNPLDSYSFASASFDRTVKIWSRYSPKPKATVGDNPAGLLSVHYFTDGNNRHNLIFGSSNGSAQVWDPESEIRVQTLNGHANRLSAFYWHQECPMLITGSHDGTIRIWNSTTYRLETIINLDLGAVYAIGYVKGLRRIGVGCHRGIAMVKI